MVIGKQVNYYLLSQRDDSKPKWNELTNIVNYPMNAAWDEVM